MALWWRKPESFETKLSQINNKIGLFHAQIDAAEEEANRIADQVLLKAAQYRKLKASAPSAGGGNA